VEPRVEFKCRSTVATRVRKDKILVQTEGIFRTEIQELLTGNAGFNKSTEVKA
jgi:hypothetical protein